jgi:hypothetical protein
MRIGGMVIGRVEKEQYPDQNHPWRPYLSFILRSVESREDYLHGRRCPEKERDW